MSATGMFQLLNGHPGTKLEEPWFTLLALSCFYLQTLETVISDSCSGWSCGAAGVLLI